MADYITTILTTITEHPQAIAAVASVYGVAKPFLAKILGPAADEVGEIGRDYVKGFRAVNTAKTLAGASEMLSEAAVEPQPIAPKVLLPLLDGASLEDDEFLRRCWASLLANAANSENTVEVSTGFVEIMKQLSTIQVRILNALVPDLSKSGVARDFTEMSSSDFIQKKLTDIPLLEFDVAVDHLVRLRLCQAAGTIPMETVLTAHPEHSAHIMAMAMGPGAANIGITSLGRAFLKACRPPQPVKTI